jgi:hypothetical protein
LFIHRLPPDFLIRDNQDCFFESAGDIKQGPSQGEAFGNRTSALKDCERLEKRGGATEFLCRDQLLQVEQQALSQPAKGFDFFGYRFMRALQRRRNRDEEAVQNRQASFSVGGS